jgi:hypothetical protein
MTLLDAPEFNAARDRRNRIIIYSTLSVVVTVFVVWWLIAGHPLDWPWNWDAYIFGRSRVNSFFTAVEQNDLQKAYGIWFNDANWQKHPAEYNAYSFARFEQDWSATSPQNEYGPIHSHSIVAERYVGNVLVAGILLNGRKSSPVFLAYDPRDRTLSFSPIQLYLGP